MPIFMYIAAAVLAYLLGSIPTGYLVAKARGIDIRTVGSGNIGATNVFRYLGVPAGIFVLLVDAAKGLVACALLPKALGALFSVSAVPAHWEWLAIVSGFSAVLGHNYTCWLHFKGGKGIATSAGVLIGLVPLALLVLLGIWLIVFAATRYVSLASIAAAFSLPFAAWLTGSSTRLVVICAIMGALAIYKHKSNIERLLKGTESRIGAKKAPPVSSPSNPTS